MYRYTPVIEPGTFLRMLRHIPLSYTTRWYIRFLNLRNIKKQDVFWTVRRPTITLLNPEIHKHSHDTLFFGLKRLLSIRSSSHLRTAFPNFEEKKYWKPHQELWGEGGGGGVWQQLWISELCLAGGGGGEGGGGGLQQTLRPKFFWNSSQPHSVTKHSSAYRT